MMMNRQARVLFLHLADPWDLRVDETGRCYLHAETSGESGLAAKSLCRVRAAFRVAKEVGEGVGRGQVLLGPLPEGAKMTALPQVNSHLRKRILIDSVKDTFASVSNPVKFLSLLNFETHGL